MTTLSFPPGRSWHAMSKVGECRSGTVLQMQKEAGNEKGESCRESTLETYTAPSLLQSSDE